MNEVRLGLRNSTIERVGRNDCRFLPLSRLSLTGTLICLGGRCENSNPIDFIEIYDPQSDKWNSRMEFPFAGRQAGIAVIGSSIFVLGGYDKRNQMLPSGILNARNGNYSMIPQMPLIRRGCAVTQFNEKYIFTMGGTDCGNFSAFAVRIDTLLECCESGKTTFAMFAAKIDILYN